MASAIDSGTYANLATEFPDLAQKFATTFLTKGPAFIAAVERHHAAKEFESVAFNAHTFKSTSNWIGAHSLGNVLNQLETSPQDAVLVAQARTHYTQAVGDLNNLMAGSS